MRRHPAIAAACVLLATLLAAATLAPLAGARILLEDRPVDFSPPTLTTWNPAYDTTKQYPVAWCAGSDCSGSTSARLFCCALGFDGGSNDYLEHPRTVTEPTVDANYRDVNTKCSQASPCQAHASVECWRTTTKGYNGPLPSACYGLPGTGERKKRQDAQDLPGGLPGTGDRQKQGGNAQVAPGIFDRLRGPNMTLGLLDTGDSGNQGKQEGQSTQQQQQQGGQGQQSSDTPPMPIIPADKATFVSSLLGPPRLSQLGFGTSSSGSGGSGGGGSGR